MSAWLTLLCIAICAVIVLCQTPCSTDQMREMLMRACAGDYNYKRRRSIEKEEGPKHNEILWGSRIRHPKQFKIIANDTSGGLLIRHKRGVFESFMYCCLNVGNCTEIFSC